MKESGEVLDAAAAFGIDLTRLYYGAEKNPSSSGEVIVDLDKVGNRSKQMKKIFDQKKKVEGKEIVFISKKINKVCNETNGGNSYAKPAPAIRPTAPEEVDSVASNLIPNTVTTIPRAQGTPLKKSSLSKIKNPTPENVSNSKQQVLQVKKEVQSTEEEDNVENESCGNDSKIEPTNHASTTAPGRPENLQNQCEKCPKSFASITLLRYHYCSHFRTVLKKRFANMYNDDKCLVCAKTFPNPGRLLLHIGINHDKINEILKTKGITELPSYSSGAQDGMEPPHEPENDEAANDDDANVAMPNPSLTKDIKNIPLLGSQSANPVVGGPVTSASASVVEEPLNSKSISNSTLKATTTQIPTAVTKAPTAAPIETNSSFDKNDPTAECNYELECQVCDQKLKTISLLEQHCCRHFMKELQDHYSSLMDGLKCNVCYSNFKQKHSLLLHIGCKHGKINDILR